MSKRGLPDDLMDQTLTSRRSSQPAPVGDDPMELVQIPLPRSMKSDLQRIFQSRGLSMSAGVRTVLADYRNQAR